MEFTDLSIFVFVLGLRLFVPLLIPRYPLIGIVLALIIDAIDQTIFQLFTEIDLTSYQSYDKALDIYYLTIAYISTFRNWTNLSAIKIASFLWYYRLVGVLLFELTYTGEGPRWLLFIFPNTFEYFFIFYEIVASFWNPLRLTKKHLIRAAAFIWIFIKLPQEYWIHIAQMDTTDFLKENVFHVPLDATLSEIIAANMWLPFVFFVSIIGLFYLSKYLLHKLPPKEWRFKLSRTALKMEKQGLVIGSGLKRLFNKQLLEKVILVTFVTTIFSQIVPGLQVNMVYLAIGVALIIGANTLLSQFLHSKNFVVKNVFLEFFVILLMNTVLFSLLDFFSTRLNAQRLDLGAMFFLYILSIIVALYDWYYDDYVYRFNKA